MSFDQSVHNHASGSNRVLIHTYAQLAHWSVVIHTTVEDRCEKDKASLCRFLIVVFFSSSSLFQKRKNHLNKTMNSFLPFLLNPWLYSNTSAFKSPHNDRGGISRSAIHIQESEVRELAPECVDTTPSGSLVNRNSFWFNYPTVHFSHRLRKINKIFREQ